MRTWFYPGFHPYSIRLSASGNRSEGDPYVKERGLIETPVHPAGPSADAQPSFVSGQLLAGRFKIVRFLGRGGMGEVYEAEDLELHENVALKTMRSDIASDERALERFKREIHVARKVTHPNVCRTFDIFHHRSDVILGVETTFLTMELLSGQNLQARLERTGPMTAAQALPLVTQMAAGLDAAHRAGVVHRDFKSANVVLVPLEDGNAVRAVVSDFGLARGRAEGAHFSAAATLEGVVTGSPLYMSPEQVAGEPITPATDIYALGVVMYEMMTGTWPFVGENPLQTAVKRLTQPPPSPLSHAPDLDRKWEAVILRCLERQPEKRFQTAAEVASALGADGLATSELKLKRRSRALVAASIAAVMAGALGYAFRDHTAPGDLSAPSSARRSVAVLGFKNLSGRQDAAWLSTALSEMLTTELAAGEKLRTIPGENVARMKIDLALADAESFGRDTLLRIRKNLGADVVVVGSYLALGQGAGVRLDVRIQDATLGETIAALSREGDEKNLVALVSDTGALLREKLGVGALTAIDSSGLRASLPRDPEAARLYAEGLQKLRAFDAMGAKELLDRASARAPEHPLTHAALADAWSELGYDAKATAEAKRALDLSQSLTREEKLSVEGRYREKLREWDKAVEIYRTLFRFFPDNLDYGLRLAEAQTSAGRGKDALDTVEALRKLPSPASEDPRIDLSEARAAGSLGDLERQQEAAGRAAKRGALQGARLLVARSRIEEGSALNYLGERELATAAFEDATAVYRAAGDQRGVVKALGNLASLYWLQGDLEGAARLQEETFSLSRATGNKDGMAVALNNLGLVLQDQGRLLEAKENFEQATALRREVGDKAGVAAGLNNIAMVLYKRGDLAGAKKGYDDALQVARELGNQRFVGTILLNTATVRFEQGDLVGAQKMFEESLGVNRTTGERGSDAHCLLGLAEVHMAQGDLAGARRYVEQALAIWKDLGEKGSCADGEMQLAVVLIEEGRPAEAETLTRRAVEHFQSEQQVDQETVAHAVLARSLLAQRKIPEAREAVSRAVALSRKTQDRRKRLDVTLTAARVAAASGDRKEAIQKLEAARAEARRAGMLGYELEARLQLVSIERKSGSLESLAEEARAKGYGLLSRKALDLAKSSK